MNRIQSVREAALKLSLPDRAVLAADLLETLRMSPPARRFAREREERRKWFLAAVFAGLVMAGVGLAAILKS